VNYFNNLCKNSDDSPKGMKILMMIFFNSLPSHFIIQTMKSPTIASDKSKLCHHPQLCDLGYHIFDQGV